MCRDMFPYRTHSCNTPYDMQQQADVSAVARTPYVTVLHGRVFIRININRAAADAAS